MARPLIPSMRRALLIVLALALLGLAYSQWNVVGRLRDGMLQLQQLGSWGGVIFLLAYALSVVVLIPGSILGVGAGVVYGLGWGTLLVTLGAWLGSTVAFFIGRYGARNFAQRHMRAHPRLAALDRALGGSSLRLVFLLRLHPLLPYNLLNYALGATAVSTRDYVLGNIGIIPGVLLCVGLGTLAGHIILHPEIPDNPHTASLRLLAEVVAACLAVAASIWLVQVGRKAVRNGTGQGRSASFA